MGPFCADFCRGGGSIFAPITILRQLLPEDDKKGLLSNLTKQKAYLMIKEHHEEWANLPVTYAQEIVLRQHFKWRPGMRRGEADCTIKELKGGW